MCSSLTKKNRQFSILELKIANQKHLRKKSEPNLMLIDVSVERPKNIDLFKIEIMNHLKLREFDIN